MPRRDFQSLGDLLGSGGLGRLAREAEAHRDLTARVRARLPEAEAAHLVSVHAEAGRWVVAMDSPAWAARVRYRAAELGGAVPVRVTVVPQGQSGKPGAS